MTEYEFAQCFAEAVHRIVRPPVERYLTAVADDLGWPIPHKYRRQVIIGLARLVRAQERASRHNERCRS